ncbi:TRF2-interacting telomeric protein/Rap1 C terminal domain-containing protein [Aspergillus coremiiformis]|uniref:DNA-binding protein RAP1 n=1 Tax=Aspergillus coremiiformis TaxID=138285 RepID=A0A5N6Z1U0_9EURO|nr:TRF2-interacting telomeric protein/Rap1 C terminal domain-containing protein [Aspergillus coremiiformis]
MIENMGAMEEKNSRTSSSPLFQGQQFWLSQNIPQRSRFKDIIQQYGGIIRLYEKDADIKLVDHAKKNLPPDTYSYRYVEWSVRNGKLEDLEKHRAGPSAARPVGATHIPTRRHRLPYTLEDDQYLWDQMVPYEEDPNASIHGNKIYQKLAAQNPRHTYQSYRDRYLKTLRGHPRPGGMSKPDHPPSTREDGQRQSPGRERSAQSHENHSQCDYSTMNKLDDRKRKRTPEPDNTHRELNGVHLTSQKRRVIDTTSKHSIPAMIHTEQSKSPEGQRTPMRAPSVNIETSSTQNISTSVQPQAPESLDYNSDNAVDPFFLELPFLPSTPEPEPEEAPEQDMDTWIDDRLRTGRAENEEQIIKALRCTSMDPHLADKVLDYIVAGKGIPGSMPGVWTAEDDGCIEAKETRPVERVLKKHGSEFFNTRWEYLEMTRGASLDGTES